MREEGRKKTKRRRRRSRRRRGTGRGRRGGVEEEQDWFDYLPED